MDPGIWLLEEKWGNVDRKMTNEMYKVCNKGAVTKFLWS